MRALLLLALALSGCSFGDAEPPLALEAARARWADAGVDAYRFTFARGCECAQEWTGPFTVEVRDGAIVAATRRGVPLDPADDALLTLDGVFAFAVGALAADPYRFEATYDARYGFPERISVDYAERAVDDEIDLFVTDFEPLP